MEGLQTSYTVRDNMSRVADGSVFAFYLALIVINAILIMSGTIWSTLNAAAVVALVFSVWYVLK